MTEPRTYELIFKKSSQTKETTILRAWKSAIGLIDHTCVTMVPEGEVPLIASTVNADGHVQQFVIKKNPEGTYEVISVQDLERLSARVSRGVLTFRDNTGGESFVAYPNQAGGANVRGNVLAESLGNVRITGDRFPEKGCVVIFDGDIRRGREVSFMVPLRAPVSDGQYQFTEQGLSVLGIVHSDKKIEFNRDFLTTYYSSHLAKRMDSIDVYRLSSDGIAKVMDDIDPMRNQVELRPGNVVRVVERLRGMRVTDYTLEGVDERVIATVVSVIGEKALIRLKREQGAVGTFKKREKGEG